MGFRGAPVRTATTSRTGLVQVFLDLRYVGGGDCVTNASNLVGSKPNAPGNTMVNFHVDALISEHLSRD